MDLPGILPSDLKNLDVVATDRELYDQLLVSTERLTRFFSFAADDETWSSKHGEFYSLVLAWFTRQYLQDRIKESHVKTILLAFQEHYGALESFLPRPLTIQMGEDVFPVNPFVIGSMSSYLRSLLKRGIQEKNARTIEIPNSSLDLVQFILHYLESGSVEGLWRFERPVLLKLLELAEKWGVSGLVLECQEVLMRYINQDNVQEELIQAIKKSRWILLERCKEIFNDKFVDGRILNCGEGVLTFEFLNYDERAFLAFDCVKNLVTHLCFKEDLILDEQFYKVMNQSPRLTGLNLSETNSWSPFFPEIPQKVHSLDLSKCAWLGDGELRLLLSLLPKISILNLSENTQITYRGFAELKNLYGLKSLSLEKCFQLENDALNLILQGAGGLTELNLHGCRKLSESSFSELGKRAPHLKKLVLSRTTITDGGLSDIAFKSQELAELELDHCLNISESGLFDCVRLAKLLEVLSIKDNRFNLKAIKDLKDQYPDLVIKD